VAACLGLLVAGCGKSDSRHTDDPATPASKQASPPAEEAVLPNLEMPGWLLGHWTMDRRAFASRFPHGLGDTQRAQLAAIQLRYWFEAERVHIEERGMGEDRTVVRELQVTWTGEDRCILVSYGPDGSQEVTRIRLVNDQLNFTKNGVQMTLIRETIPEPKDPQAVD